MTPLECNVDRFSQGDATEAVAKASLEVRQCISVKNVILQAIDTVAASLAASACSE